MNENLKSLNAQLAKVREAQSEVSGKLGDIGAERHEIETAANDRAAAVSAAEQDLVDSLAREELGEKSDVEAARQRLNAARAQAENGVGTAQRLRVLDVLAARFNAEATALHEKAAGLMREIAAAEAEILRAKAEALRDEATAAMRTIARLEHELPVLRNLIVERGGSWDMQPLSEGAIAHQYRASVVGRNVAADLLADLQAAA